MQDSVKCRMEQSAGWVIDKEEGIMRYVNLEEADRSNGVAAEVVPGDRRGLKGPRDDRWF